MTGAGPPKCPVCGKTEWRHLCSGPALPLALKGLEREAGLAGRSSRVRRLVAPAEAVDVVFSDVGDGVALISSAHPVGEKTGKMDISPAAIETVEAPPAVVALVKAKKGRGRPKKVSDLKAYKAEKEREYRAKKKAKKGKRA